MSEIQRYRDLQVWQRGINLTLVAYGQSRRLPRLEQFELAKQMRKAASSIPANVAEGHELGGAAYAHHVKIALGSLAELETHVEVAIRLGYLTREDAQTLFLDAGTLGRMLNGLHRSLRRRLAKQVIATAVCLSTIVILCLA